MAPPTDIPLAMLLQRAQAGDRASYRQFLLEARQLVKGLLRRRLRTPEAIDDVLQEALLSIHRARHTYDPSRPIEPWIRAIALNRLRDSGRARKRRQDHEALDHDWEQSQHVSGDTSAPTFLRAALDVLSEAQREVIWLLKFEGYSVAEISGRTGRSVGSIKVTAHRGYRALRAWVKSP